MTVLRADAVPGHGEALSITEGPCRICYS